MDKEMHIWMGYDYPDRDFNSFNNYCAVSTAIVKGVSTINTGLICFCSTGMFDLGYRLFVHMLDGKTVEIKLGKNDCTSREIRMGHNLQHLLLANDFGYAVN